MAASRSSPLIVVAVGVVLDSRGRVLLTRRPVGAHQGGLWEFPGGKVEASETIAEALRREMREELAIEVEAHEPMLVLEHDYGDRHVRLDVHYVTDFSGEPRPREGQPMAWVARTELSGYAFPAANAAIIDHLMAADGPT